MKDWDGVVWEAVWTPSPAPGSRTCMAPWKAVWPHKHGREAQWMTEGWPVSLRILCLKPALGLTRGLKKAEDRGMWVQAKRVPVGQRFLRARGF